LGGHGTCLPFHKGEFEKWLPIIRAVNMKGK
jgi:hypothetical protein